jgi:hypothetical protein
MAVEEYEKDKETGDSERKFVRNTGMSPLERYFTLIEDAYAVGDAEGLACVHSAANIAAPILCGRVDEHGNRKYFIAKAGTEEEEEGKNAGMKNLYNMFHDVYNIKAGENINLRFYSGGVKGSVGKNFTIEGQPGTEEAVQRACIKEANRLALAEALEKLIHISAKLGEEGLVDPLRKLSVAGENLRMRQNIEADMVVYKIFKEDFEARERELIKSQKEEIERIKAEVKNDG